MTRPQIAVRIPPSIFEKLNKYVDDVVVRAIAQYLSCAKNVPLINRVDDLEKKMAELEFQVRSQTVDE